LFHSEAKEFYLPELESSNVEDAYNELELLGFPLTMDMFDLVKTSYRGDVMANELGKHIGKTIRTVGNYVCEKPVRTKNNKKMWFGTFLDKDGNFIDTVHFPLSTPAYPFRGKGCYLIEGKVVEEFGFPSIDVKKFGKLEIRDNPVF
jgi:hypothetical protein